MGPIRLQLGYKREALCNQQASKTAWPNSIEVAKNAGPAMAVFGMMRFGARTHMAVAGLPRTAAGHRHRGSAEHKMSMLARREQLQMRQ